MEVDVLVCAHYFTIHPICSAIRLLSFCCFRFNYRSTHHLTTNGFYEFLNWFDERAWYPLGRIVGGTVSFSTFARNTQKCSVMVCLNKMHLGITLHGLSLRSSLQGSWKRSSSWLMLVLLPGHCPTGPLVVEHFGNMRFWGHWHHTCLPLRKLCMYSQEHVCVVLDCTSVFFPWWHCWVIKSFPFGCLRLCCYFSLMMHRC